MQTRLLASLAGGFGGLLCAAPISGALGIGPTAAYIGCALLGAGLGYAVSIFFDVFAESADADGESN